MEMLQNVSNCHKSERSRNRNNCLILLLYWSLFEDFLGWFEAFGREIEVVIFNFMFAEC